MLIIFLFILGSACLSWVLFQMIQPGQILGFWQNVLDRVYRFNEFMSMFLGGCYKCFANFIAHITFAIYLFIYGTKGWIDLPIYLGYVSGCIVLAMIVNRIIDKENV